MGGSWIALVVFLVPALLNPVFYAPAMSHIYSRVAPQDRPVAAALLMFASHLFGLGLGALFVGVVSDLAQNVVAAPVGLGLLLLQSLGVCAAWCLWRAGAISSAEQAADLAEDQTDSTAPSPR